MTTIQNLSVSLTISEVLTPHKIDSSVGTEGTFSDLFKKKVSLCCSSSISLEQMIQKTDKKQIFAKYLMGLESRKQLENFQKLRQAYDSIQMEESQAAERYIDVSEGDNDIKGMILSYFIGIWLKSMGYGTQKTRNYLQGRAKLFLGTSSLHSFTKLYHNLNQLQMTQSEKMTFLLNTCRYGWEHFIQQIGKRKLLSFSSESSEKKSRGSILTRN